MRPILCAAAGLALVFGARAANLVTYTFDDNLDAAVTQGVTATGFLGNGSKAVVGLNPDNSYGYILIKKKSTSVSSSVSNKQYAQFTITAPDTGGIQLSGFQISAAKGGDSSPRGFVIRWSYDNYSTNLGQATVDSMWPSRHTYNLNFSAYIGGSVTFRIYAYADEISNAEPSIRFDTITAVGSVQTFPPTVTPKATRITTDHVNYVIRGTAWSPNGISRVEVAKKNPNAVYSGANGTSNWNYKATNLKTGSNVFYVRSIDYAGNVSAPVRVVIKRTKPKPKPTPTSSPLP